ncbi:uncharacterized protein LOC135131341 [Zophobas morio]|uniref:uncharacterized protein LOC135131341 n=1 Tax=Zophobas morio TaxID=2755281 RepID=UPI003083A688
MRSKVVLCVCFLSVLAALSAAKVLKYDSDYEGEVNDEELRQKRCNCGEEGCSKEVCLSNGVCVDLCSPSVEPKSKGDVVSQTVEPKGCTCGDDGCSKIICWSNGVCIDVCNPGYFPD